jgi:hypothetical protein
LIEAEREEGVTTLEDQIAQDLWTALCSYGLLEMQSWTPSESSQHSRVWTVSILEGDVTNEFSIEFLFSTDLPAEYQPLVSTIRELRHRVVPE